MAALDDDGAAFVAAVFAAGRPTVEAGASEELIFVDGDDLARARAAVDRGDADAAVDLLGGFRGISPAAELDGERSACLAAATSRRAAAALRDSRPRAAAADACRALALRPRDGAAWLVLSRASRGAGDHETARRAAAFGLRSEATADVVARAPRYEEDVDGGGERLLRTDLRAALDAAESDGDAARQRPATSGPVAVVGLEPLVVVPSAAASTGGVLWDGGLLLAHWLLSRGELVRGKRVLVLGAGVGLEGLVCAKKLSATAVAFTDCDATVLASLRASLELNGVENGTVERLDFTAPQPRGDFDLVLGGEVCYYDDAARLADCVDARLGAAGCAVFVAARGRPGLAAFLSRCAASFRVAAAPAPAAVVAAARAHEPRAARRAILDVVVLTRRL